MPNANEPWEPEERHGGPHARGRLILWIAVVLVVGFGLWKLAERYPGQISSDADQARLVQLAIIALIASGAIFASRIRFGEFARSLSIWLGLTAVIFLGYTYRGELQSVFSRTRAELLPSEPVSVNPNELVLTANNDGHFFVFGEANGVRVRFLIDTGASDVVIGPSDARRMGVDVSALKFTHLYETANGRGWGAPLTLASLVIGPIALSGVSVSVNQAEMSSSLLGMTFLRRMDSFEVRGDKLILRWH